MRLNAFNLAQGYPEREGDNVARNHGMQVQERRESRGLRSQPSGHKARRIQWAYATRGGHRESSHPPQLLCRNLWNQ